MRTGGSTDFGRVRCRRLGSRPGWSEVVGAGTVRIVAGAISFVCERHAPFDPGIASEEAKFLPQRGVNVRAFPGLEPRWC